MARDPRAGHGEPDHVAGVHPHRAAAADRTRPARGGVGADPGGRVPLARLHRRLEHRPLARLRGRVRRDRPGVRGVRGPALPAARARPAPADLRPHPGRLDGGEPEPGRRHHDRDGDGLPGVVLVADDHRERAAQRPLRDDREHRRRRSRGRPRRPPGPAAAGDPGPGPHRHRPGHRGRPGRGGRRVGHRGGAGLLQHLGGPDRRLRRRKRRRCPAAGGVPGRGDPARPAGPEPRRAERAGGRGRRPAAGSGTRCGRPCTTRPWRCCPAPPRPGPAPTAASSR